MANGKTEVKLNVIMSLFFCLADLGVQMMVFGQFQQVFITVLLFIKLSAYLIFVEILSKNFKNSSNL